MTDSAKQKDCYKCKLRYVGCHSTCGIYKSNRAKLDEMNRAKFEAEAQRIAVIESNTNRRKHMCSSGNKLTHKQYYKRNH